MTVGFPDTGAGVGDGVGAGVGEGVGAVVGLPVGKGVGTNVGLAVGLLVGLAVAALANTQTSEPGVPPTSQPFGGAKLSSHSVFKLGSQFSQLFAHNTPTQVLDIPLTKHAPPGLPPVELPPAPMDIQSWLSHARQLSAQLP